MNLKRYFSNVSSPSTSASGTAAQAQAQGIDADATTVGVAQEQADGVTITAQTQGTDATTVGVEAATAAQAHEARAEGIKEFNPDHIVVDPGLRIPIDEFDPNIRDQVRRAYLSKGPTQPIGHTFPHKKYGKGFKVFREAWYKKYDWLEYSVEKDAAFCFYCFLFRHDPLDEKFGHDVFTKVRFST